jgi:hypothetical protein
MNLRRPIVLILCPLLLSLIVVVGSWFVNPKFWYFRGYEFYSDWVYTGLAEPSITMSESGDSSREFLFDRISTTNQISLNKYGHRVSPCNYPEVVALGDSQMFGSGLSDRQTFPFQLLAEGGPCIYNAGRHNTIDAFQIPELNFTSVLVTSTERDGFTWYCDLQPESWDFSKSDSQSLQLQRVSAPRLALETAIERTISVVRGKVQNLLALRLQAPRSRLVKFQHSLTPEAIKENVECVVRLNAVFAEHGLDASFLLFPAAQTIYPEDAPVQPDSVTLSFISSLSTELRLRGIRTIDSKDCLMGQQSSMVQLHDTHLSPEGTKRLAHCVMSAQLLVSQSPS